MLNRIFCDGWISAVRVCARPSEGVRPSTNALDRLNHRVELHTNFTAMIIGGPISKLFKEINSMQISQNSGRCGMQNLMKTCRPSCKNLQIQFKKYLEDCSFFDQSKTWPPGDGTNSSNVHIQ